MILRLIYYFQTKWMKWLTWERVLTPICEYCRCEMWLVKWNFHVRLTTPRKIVLINLHPEQTRQLFDDIVTQFIQIYGVSLMLQKNIWENTIYFARNSFLRQKLQKDLSFSLTVEELKVFEWILFFSSHHHLSQSKLYWRRGVDALFPLVEKATSWNRFDKITSYLQFNDNSRIDNFDDAFKFRPLTDKTNGSFESNLAVDDRQIFRSS